MLCQTFRFHITTSHDSFPWVCGIQPNYTADRSFPSLALISAQDSAGSSAVEPRATGKKKIRSVD